MKGESHGMSDAIQIVKTAPLHIESLLTELFVRQRHRQVSQPHLPGRLRRSVHIQIQLVVVLSNPAS